MPFCRDVAMSRGNRRTHMRDPDQPHCNVTMCGRLIPMTEVWRMRDTRFATTCKVCRAKWDERQERRT